MIPGDFIKVRIADGGNQERIWAKIRLLDAGGGFAGLDNDPVCAGYARGDVIRFSRSDILDYFPMPVNDQ